MIRRTTRLVIALLAFLKATLIGGLFVLAPLVLLIAIIGQAISVAYHAVHPLVAYLPFQSVGGVSLALISGIVVVVALCFVAGLLAHTAMATWLVKWIEGAVLSNLPGYALVKSMGEGLIGVQSRDGRQAVLVHFEHSSQIGFQMDRLGDSRMVIFIPGVPSPWSGQLHIVPESRCELLPVSVRNAIEVLQRLGLDAHRLLQPQNDLSKPQDSAPQDSAIGRDKATQRLDGTNE